MSSIDPEVPPTGEEIHLPGPSMDPLLLTVGITMALLGVTTSIFLVIAGVLLSLVITVRWIRAARNDIDELPLEPHH
ncbi:MAG TPA: hypothetical protein VHF51_18570 [Solirubrobacteraceae bacterium]|jgi:hypothetical protein|nr:hypothetical protein [Solirubrobacteraceae bacterium]